VKEKVSYQRRRGSVNLDTDTTYNSSSSSSLSTGQSSTGEQQSAPQQSKPSTTRETIPNIVTVQARLRTVTGPDPLLTPGAPFVTSARLPSKKERAIKKERFIVVKL